jgi:hypothetical protein
MVVSSLDRSTSILVYTCLWTWPYSRLALWRIFCEQFTLPRRPVCLFSILSSSFPTTHIGRCRHFFTLSLSLSLSMKQSNVDEYCLLSNIVSRTPRASESCRVTILAAQSCHTKVTPPLVVISYRIEFILTYSLSLSLRLDFYGALRKLTESRLVVFSMLD